MARASLDTEAWVETAGFVRGWGATVETMEHAGKAVAVMRRDVGPGR